VLQAYGSITEDYNTAMGLLGGGFSSMFLNELLIFGIAPDDIMTVLTQRQRWAMGSLQILCLDNPLTKGGLTIPQSLLFYQVRPANLLTPDRIKLSAGIQHE
jgi:cellulose synthase (UDP-forming)